MSINSENLAQVSVGDFISKAIRLSNHEFEATMRLHNGDESIDNVKMVACSISTYDRC